jgi:hypothetical protein
MQVVAANGEVGGSSVMVQVMYGYDTRDAKCFGFLMDQIFSIFIP